MPLGRTELHLFPKIRPIPRRENRRAAPLLSLRPRARNRGSSRPPRIRASVPHGRPPRSRSRLRLKLGRTREATILATSSSFFSRILYTPRIYTTVARTTTRRSCTYRRGGGGARAHRQRCIMYSGRERARRAGPEEGAERTHPRGMTDYCYYYARAVRPEAGGSPRIEEFVKGNPKLLGLPEGPWHRTRGKYRLRSRSLSGGLSGTGDVHNPAKFVIKEA